MDEATLTAPRGAAAEDAPSGKKKTRHPLSLGARPDAAAGLILLVAAILVALLAPWIAPYDPNGQELNLALKPPFFLEGAHPAHWLGTDGLGRDLLSIIIYGFRISLTVGISSVLISTALGVALGLWAGYQGGRAETVIMRLADFQLSLPTVLVALAVIAIFGSGVGKLILLIGLNHWCVYGRTVRASVRATKEREFIEGARAIGARPSTVVFRHILPSVMTPVLILAAVELPRVMLLESSLSFLGLGVPPTVPSLGGAIAHGYEFIFSGHWSLTILPGFALMIIVVSINLLGDWLRDVFDPRMQH